MRRNRLSVLCGVLFAVSCYHGVDDGPDTAGIDRPDASSGATDPNAGENASNGDDTSEDDGMGSSGAPSDDPSVWVLANEIALTRLEFNQGISVSLIDGGEIVAPSHPILPQRPARVRAVWQLGPEFTAKTIVARLIIEDGTMREELEDERFITDTPNVESHEAGFFWDVPGESIHPGATFAVELLEERNAPHASVTGRPRIPDEGLAPLPVTTETHRMEIVVVPMQYTAGGASLVPNLDASNRQMLEHALYDQNPVAELSISYRDPVTYSLPIRNGAEMSEALGHLSSFRSQQSVAPHVYYVGLVNLGCQVAGCGFSGTSGLAYVASDSQSVGNQRVSLSVWFQPEISATTVTHELGHNQGLRHVACPTASSSNPEPSYPHAQGKIGVWGFGPLSGRIVSNSAHDYMSYCDPRWVSDFGWSRTRERIVHLSSWAQQQTVAYDEVPALLGIIHPSGDARWFEIRQPTNSFHVLDERSDVAALWRGEHVLGEVPVQRGEIADSTSAWVIAPLPAGVVFDDVERIEWRSGATMVGSFEVAANLGLRP